jgi:dephospho-CoA kinase
MALRPSHEIPRAGIYPATMATSSPTSSRFRPTIGIVGGIGSGKSAVARAFAALGCEVCVSDDLARRVLDEPAVRAEIVRAAGASVARDDGSIDRARLAQAIFTDPSVRAAVERAMHPRIEALRRAQFAAAADSAPAFVIDAPLLLEVGIDRECDAVVFVDASDEARRARVSATRGWSADELARRESAQLPLAEKRARSSDILANNADESALSEAVRALLATIVARGPRAGRSAAHGST